ncbi:major facilitator superfamily domain-containing protein [Dendryphion nanum]|uniref:Major facilitator superfamily domain-containing protein n=1 Tax=Dendryphion nanum TaxID=256645 RepID=A0A9P9DNW3_9PLEO|nr:major facilitator superfamily domain-containing protein [Dendryphion nanum]
MIALRSSRTMFSSDAYAIIVVTSAVFTILPFIPQLLEGRLGLPHSQVLAGYLSDRFRSKKTPFLLGLVSMMVSSPLLFLSTHIAGVITARAFQGISAAFVWVSGLAFLTSHIDASNIGTAMSWITIGGATGELVGPLVGGVLYEEAGHFSVMALVLAILGVDIGLRMLLTDKPQMEGHGPEPVDDEIRPLLVDNENTNGYRGVKASSITNAESSQVPGTKRWAILEDKDLLNLCASFFAATVTGIMRFALEATLVVFVQSCFGWSASASGSIIFALLAPAIIAPVVSRMTEKYSPRWMSVGVFFFISALLVVLGFLTHPTKSVEVAFIFVIIGIGIGLATLTTAHTVAFSMAARSREERAKRENRATTSTGQSFGALNVAWAVDCISKISRR